MVNREYVYECTLRTFGLNRERFDRICGDLLCKDIDIKFEEHNLSGKITISKSAVDDIALENVLSKMTVRLEDYIYANKDVDLNYSLVRRLAKEGEMLAVAESVTGGMLCSAICDVGGASDVFYEGIISYNSGAKVRRLHVPATVIQEHTAVSRETCEAMLRGVLANKEVKYGIVTTGYADNKDSALSGLVYIGYGSIGDFYVDELRFDGGRNEVRAKVVNCAIFKLLKLLDKNNRKY